MKPLVFFGLAALGTAALFYAAPVEATPGRSRGYSLEHD